MSAVSESIAQRVTLGMLVERYGFEVDPPFATNVTITSLSDAVDTVIPGSLFICTHEQEPDVLHAAQAGAYAALLPRASKGQIANADIPLLYGDFDDRVLGDLASGLAGGPSNAMAVFAVTGADEQAVDAGVSQLSEFLHMLGNPVGVVKSSGSTSLERELDLTYPLSILDVQQTLSVCAEDGAAAMVFALNDRTLKSDALTSVNVDVIGLDSARDLRQPTPSGTGEDSRAGEGGEAASPSGQWASGEEPAGSAGDARDDLAQARQLGRASASRSTSRPTSPVPTRNPTCSRRRPRSPRTATVSVNCRSPLPWLWRRGFAETTFAVRCAYLTNWLMERKTRHERRGNDDAYDRSAGGRGGPRQADRPADGRRRRRRSRCTGHVGGQRFAPGP